MTTPHLHNEIQKVTGPSLQVGREENCNVPFCLMAHFLKPGGMMKVVQKLRYDLLHYSASATTSLTSGIMRFIMPSIPAFRVIMEEGQPEQEPCSIRLTTPSL